MAFSSLFKYLLKDKQKMEEIFLFVFNLPELFRMIFLVEVS